VEMKKKNVSHKKNGEFNVKSHTKNKKKLIKDVIFFSSPLFYTIIQLNL